MKKYYAKVLREFKEPEPPLPAECQAHKEGGFKKCRESLLCVRCDRCISHCKCAGGPKEIPIKNRKKDDSAQIPLCDKPELRVKR
jgi:hypothetical protein